MSDLYRLVYSSRNLLDAPEGETQAEIEQILQASKANNDKVGVTGALMFNAGAFAQVLEGPRRGVEATFERIQRDIRHADVTVLQCGPAETRGFANWSMAFVGQSDRGRTMWNDLASQTGFDISRIGGDQVFTMLRDLVLDDEGMAPSPAPAEQPTRAAAALDANLVRAEIERMRPDRAAEPLSAGIAAPSPAARTHQAGERSSTERPPPRDANTAEPASTAPLAVMREALAEERKRTTDLRTQIDDLKIALAEMMTHTSTLRADRDRWAERARSLATMIADEASQCAPQSPAAESPQVDPPSKRADAA